MRERQPGSPQQLSVRSDQPLIGVIVTEGEEEVVHYFTEDQPADVVTDRSRIRKALELAGAWQDLAWEGVLETLDRIRHASCPTPPIEL
jgi:hypothetical protein